MGERIKKLCGDILPWAKKNRRLRTVILIHAVFAGFFIYCNLHTGIFGDDYGYMYIFTRAENTMTQVRAENLLDVARSMFAHYFTMNGREVPHTLLQISLLGGRGSFTVVNTLFFLLLFAGMYELVRPKGEHQPLLLLCMYVLPWALFPVYGGVFYIACWACNYMWTLAIIIAYLLPFRYLFGGRDIFASRPIFGAVIMGVGGLIAGWCSENGSAAMLFILGCMGLYFLIAKKRIPAWCFSGFALSIAGFALMLLAPSYKIRQGQAAASGAAAYPLSLKITNALIDHILPYFWYMLAAMLCTAFLIWCAKTADRRERLIFAGGCVLAAAAAWLMLTAFRAAFSESLSYEAVRSKLQILILAAAVAACVYLYIRKLDAKGRKELDLAVPVMLMLTGVIASAIMVASPWFYTRSESPFFFFFTSGAAYIFVRTLHELAVTADIEPLSVRNVSAAAFVCIFAATVISQSFSAAHTAENYKYFIERENIIEQQRSQGLRDITLPEIPEPSDRHVGYLNMFNSDADYWVNIAFTAYYDIDSVYFEQ